MLQSFDVIYFLRKLWFKKVWLKTLLKNTKIKKKVKRKIYKYFYTKKGCCHSQYTTYVGMSKLNQFNRKTVNQTNTNETAKNRIQFKCIQIIFFYSTVQFGSFCGFDFTNRTKPNRKIRKPLIKYRVNTCLSPVILVIFDLPLVKKIVQISIL